MNDLSQRGSAVEIIAEAMEEYDLPYDRMIEESSAGEIAAALLSVWPSDQVREAVLENDYATNGLLFNVTQALLAQGDRNANLAQAYERIGERLVRATRDYIFRVHAMKDADEAERLLAQRRREYQRELTMRRAYE